MVNPERAEQVRRPLTYDDRLAIEHGLNRGNTVSWIARTIDCASKVVREEIRRNWTDDLASMMLPEELAGGLRCA